MVLVQPSIRAGAYMQNGQVLPLEFQAMPPMWSNNRLGCMHLRHMVDAASPFWDEERGGARLQLVNQVHVSIVAQNQYGQSLCEVQTYLASNAAFLDDVRDTNAGVLGFDLTQGGLIVEDVKLSDSLTWTLDSGLVRGTNHCDNFSRLEPVSAEYLVL